MRLISDLEINSWNQLVWSEAWSQIWYQIFEIKSSDITSDYNVKINAFDRRFADQEFRFIRQMVKKYEPNMTSLEMSYISTENRCPADQISHLL